MTQSSLALGYCQQRTTLSPSWFYLVPACQKQPRFWMSHLPFLDTPYQVNCFFRNTRLIAMASILLCSRAIFSHRLSCLLLNFHKGWFLLMFLIKLLSLCQQIWLLSTCQRLHNIPYVLTTFNFRVLKTRQVFKQNKSSKITPWRSGKL